MSKGSSGRVVSSPMIILSIADVSRCIPYVELVSQIEFLLRSDAIREISDEMSGANHEECEF